GEPRRPPRPRIDHREPALRRGAAPAPRYRRRGEGRGRAPRRFRPRRLRRGRSRGRRGDDPPRRRRLRGLGAGGGGSGDARVQRVGKTDEHGRARTNTDLRQTLSVLVRASPCPSVFYPPPLAFSANPCKIAPLVTGRAAGAADSFTSLF